MPVRIDITKQTANGESYVASACQWNPVTGKIEHTFDEVMELADKALRLADARLVEMYTRLFEAEQIEKYCTPEEWSKVVSILDIIAGRQSINQVARRWHDAQEETAELEAGRAAASMAMCTECFSNELVSDLTVPDPNYPNVHICATCLAYEKKQRHHT